MGKANSWFYILILAVNIVLLILFIKPKPEAKIEYKDTSPTDEVLFYDNAIRYSWSNMPMINDSIYFYQVMGEKRVKAKSIAKTPSLVLRISDRNCGMCIDTIFNSIRELKLNTFNNFFVVASIDTVSRYWPNRFKAQHLNYFLAPYECLNNEIEKQTIPYFFILEGDNISNVFVPEKSFRSLTDEYLKTMRDNFLTQ